MPKFKVSFFIAALLLVSTYYCLNVFSTIPFLQHEIVGPAFWWTQPGFGFLETLFDGDKMDGGPGRFRYIEYLAQAGYWKAMAAGFLPHDLYDYFGFFGVFVCAFFLFQAAKVRNLNLLETFLVLSFFLLSSNAFLVSVFHYRKARSVFTILLAILLWVSEWKTKPRLAKAMIAAIGFFGFFCDPFFIVTVPLLILAMDFEARDYQRLKALLMGMSGAFILMLFLNGVIGPSINPKSGLFSLDDPSKKAAELLSMKNIPAFPRVIKELMVPGFVTEPIWAWERELSTPGTFTETSWIGWVCLFFLILLFLLQERKGLNGWGTTIGLLALLPVCSFLIIPISTRSLYSGYYGYPFVVVLTVVLMNVLILARTCYSKQVHYSAIGLVLLLISFHQQNAQKVFSHWVEHSLFPIGKELYIKDYAKLVQIAHFFKKNPEGSYVLERPMGKTMVGLGIGWYGHISQDRTELLDVVIPIVFREKTQAGRLTFKGKQETQFFPRHKFWSDTLRYPYHAGPVPKGTLVDVKWRTTDTTSCTVYPFNSHERELGVMSVSIYEPTVISIQCKGPGGTLEDAFAINTL